MRSLTSKIVICISTGMKKEDFDGMLSPYATFHLYVDSALVFDRLWLNSIMYMCT